MLSVRNSCISLCDVENDLETFCLFVGVVFLVVNCALLSNGYLLLFIWACHLHCIWDMVVVRGWCTIFEGRIARRDGYYISRDVSRAAKVTIIEGRVVRRDRCMDRYVPHGSRTERQLVCIIRSGMHHYTWHCIPLHCTYLSLVNLISCFADLLITFLWNLWLINIELVIADI